MTNIYKLYLRIRATINFVDSDLLMEEVAAGDTITHGGMFDMVIYIYIYIY